jgi:uncharacterized membrane protein YbhN (UPF0104 family)
LKRDGLLSRLRRASGRNGLGLALSLAIFGVASAVLFQALREVQVAKVLQAVQATAPWRIAVAGLFVACAYSALTLYDLFALRVIGRRDIPFRLAALAGFCSYAVGHNIGLTAFTGGVVRYRIYSALGLTALDVVKIAFVTGLTFWLGNAVTLGIGLLCDPDAAAPVLHLPPAFLRLIAGATLAAVTLYLLWLVPRPRRIGVDEWHVTLPNAPATLLQIAIGVADLGFTALAMYFLMPHEPAIDFSRLLVIFVLSSLLGFASHTPGGLGVFDAAMIFALLQFEREPLIAALLLFRLLYYVLPFGLALTALGLRELWLGAVLLRKDGPARD